MKNIKIKFSNQLQKDFVRDLRNSVNAYFEEKGISKYGNSAMTIKTVFMFSLYLVPYLLMVTGLVVNPVIMLFLWITMGLGMAGIGLSVMHDANHRSYSKNKAINGILSYSLNLLGGFSRTWQIQHNTLHHSFTNIDGHDEDIDPGKMLRLSPGKPHYYLHKFQHLYAWLLYGLMTITWTVDKDFKQLYRYKKEGRLSSLNKSFGLLLIELLVSKLVYYTYILVIPMMMLPVPWWTVLLFYLAMHFTCGIMLAVIFQTAHVVPSSDFPVPDAEGAIENNWAIHQLSTTSDYAHGNHFFSWFIGGLNYQVEHHLFPNICHVHYHKIAPIVQSTAKKYNLPYYVQKNFFTAVENHYRMLKTLGKKPARKTNISSQEMSFAGPELKKVLKRPPKAG